MNVFFVLLLILFLAFAGYHLSFRLWAPPLLERRFYLTGTEFLLLGAALGPRLLSIVDEATLRGLAPLSAFLLGWIGLLVGFQFDFGQLRRQGPGLLAAALVVALVTFGVVGAGAHLVIVPLLAITAELGWPVVLALAATAVCSSPLALALVAPRGGGTLPALRQVRVVAGVNSLVALTAFGLVFCFRPESAGGSFGWADFGRSAGLSLAAGTGLFLLFSLLLSLRPGRHELTLMILAVTVLSGGTAMMLDFSPLLVNFAIGMGLVNLSEARGRIGVLLESLEKPFYLLLLLFLGVGWQPDDLRLFAAAGLWVLLRLAGKAVGGWAWGRLAGQPADRRPHRFGRLLAAAGALPMAMFYDLQLSHLGTWMAAVVQLGVLAVLATDLLSPSLAASALAGEPTDAVADPR